ncbi:MAG: hypothetical protein M5U09_13740 [Gammaproteobacteria bacterium]|nr:hypothetical protein [Gammaproteobacteria bacterium]
MTDWSIRPKNFTAGTYLGAAVLTSTAELAANTEKEFTLTAFEIPKGHAVGFEFVKTGSPTSLAAVHVNVKAEWV